MNSGTLSSCHAYFLWYVLGILARLCCVLWSVLTEGKRKGKDSSEERGMEGVKEGKQGDEMKGRKGDGREGSEKGE